MCAIMGAALWTRLFWNVCGASSRRWKLRATSKAVRFLPRSFTAIWPPSAITLRLQTGIIFPTSSEIQIGNADRDANVGRRARDSRLHSADGWRLHHTPRIFALQFTEPVGH